MGMEFLGRRKGHIEEGRLREKYRLITARISSPSRNILKVARRVSRERVTGPRKYRKLTIAVHVKRRIKIHLSAADPTSAMYGNCPERVNPPRVEHPKLMHGTRSLFPLSLPVTSPRRHNKDAFTFLGNVADVPEVNVIKRKCLDWGSVYMHINLVT